MEFLFEQIGGTAVEGDVWRSRSIRNALIPLAACFTLMSTFLFFSSAAGAENAKGISLQLDGWNALIFPQSLKVVARTSATGSEIVVAEGARQQFGIRDLSQTQDSVGWTIPDLGMKVELTRQGSRLHARFLAEREQKFIWPSTGRDPAFSALIYPDGEGLFLPVRDQFWINRMTDGHCRDLNGGLSMPLWSYATEDRTATYLAESDLQTELCFDTSKGQLSTYAVHDFRARDGLPPFEVDIWLGGASPISPGIEYKNWLIARHEFVTLDRKVSENPKVTRLLGAIHAYVFGDGRTLQFLKELSDLGIDRMWLGYEHNLPDQKYQVDLKYVTEAERLGYLVGPYDEFCNIQLPESADDPTSVWDESLWKSGCIVDRNGKTLAGFAGRGCELSSEALARAEVGQHYIANRVNSNVGMGINSYFLDDDAFGELYDDYSPGHPMSMQKDRLNRLARMKYLSGTRNLVLGSEEGVGWSTPVIAFAHGMESVSNDLLWALQKDKKNFGGWWPPERPGVFFKRVSVSLEFTTARYNPVYRLPLYQAAFHSSIVNTDRWDVPLTKFPELEQTRQLLELLYDVPSMWSLDLRELRSDAPMLSKLYAFFSPVHRRAGGQPLTGFEWLTPNRKVQRTSFGDDIQLIANFDEVPYQSVPPMCIEAQRTKEQRTQLFCPGR